MVPDLKRKFCCIGKMFLARPLVSSPPPLVLTKMTFAGLDPRFVLTGVTLTDRQLGVGTFAIVLEVEYKGQKYAGKRIHDILLMDVDEHMRRGSNPIIERYMMECRLLSQLHHPNIVQFVGVYLHQVEQAPILVMELLHTDLNACIEQHGILPKNISYSILHDVAQGLHYLHTDYSVPIIHANLTARDILLTSKMSAKIRGFGSARNFDTFTRRLSRLPEAVVYMPPESLTSNPQYSTKLDVFSYGVVMMYVFSGECPAQLNLKPPTYFQEGLFHYRSEAERREKYLQAIGNDHPAMRLILHCIANKPQLRPTATIISQEIKRMYQCDGKWSACYSTG